MCECLCVNASAQEGQVKVTYGQGSRGERVRLQKSCDAFTQALRTQGHECGSVGVDCCVCVWQTGLLCGMQAECDVSLHYPICYWLAKAGNGC